MNNYMIYQKIHDLAHKKGMSLQTVAEKAGISINLIYSWKNKKNPSKTSLAKVAKVLHTTPEYLQGVKQISDEDEDLTWQDLDMPYGGKIPSELKKYYRAIAQQYVDEHPEEFK